MFGCSVNTFGPTLNSFQNKYDTNDETISRVFTISTVGLVAGAFSSGFLFRYVNRQLAVAAFMACLAGLMFVLPYCPTLTTYFVAAGLAGVFSGFWGSAQFVWILEMMQKECPPYVQGQHFFYALGTILSTIVMAPFLDKGDGNDDDPQANITMSFSNLTVTGNDMSGKDVYNLITENEDGDGSEPIPTPTSKLIFPFAIVGCLLVGSSLFQLFLFIFFRYHPPPPEVDTEEKSETPIDPLPSSSSSSCWPWGKIRMVILICGFIGAVQGMENCVIQFLPKFGQNSDMKLSQSDSTYVLTGLTTAYASARFVCIFIVFKVPPQLLLCFNILITTGANILLIGWAKSSLPVLWAASVMYGLGFSSMFASFSGYIERYLQITDGIGGLITVTGASLAAAYPLIVGSSIEKNPIILGYVTFFSIGVCIVTFGISSYLTFKNKTRY